MNKMLASACGLGPSLCSLFDYLCLATVGQITAEGIRYMKGPSTLFTEHFGCYLVRTAVPRTQRGVEVEYDDNTAEGSKASGLKLKP